MHESAKLGWIAWLALTLPACHAPRFKVDRPTPPPSATAPQTPTHAPSEAWPFRPESVRIDPLSSIGYDAHTKQWVLEVRLQLLDHEGDPSKGIGQTRFELYQTSARRATLDQGRRLELWNARLATPAEASKHFDDILHGYVFRLSLQTKPPETGLKLVVQWTDDRSKRMLSEAPIRIRPTKP